MRTMQLIILGIISFLLALLSIGCSNVTNVNSVNNEDIHGIVLNSEKQKDNLVFINKDYNIIGSMSVGDYIEDVQLYKKYLIAIDTGWLNNPKKELIKIDLKNKKSTKLKLPHKPHRIFINGKVGFLSSSEQAPNKKGFYLTAIDLEQLQIIDETFIPGMVAGHTVAKNKLYISINTGDPNNYGKYAQILQLELDLNNKVKLNNILKDQEEIPPSGMASDGNLIYGIYPGYIGTTKPRWLTNTDNYSQKFKTIDILSGSVINTITLPYNTPQNIIIGKDGIGFINHFSNIDLSGEYISIIDLQSNKVINKIHTSTPSNMAIDNKCLYVTNYTNDCLSIYNLNNYTKITEIKVGKWPKKVILTL